MSGKTDEPHMPAGGKVTVAVTVCRTRPLTSVSFRDNCPSGGAVRRTAEEIGAHISSADDVKHRINSHGARKVMGGAITRKSDNAKDGDTGRTPGPEPGAR